MPPPSAGPSPGFGRPRAAALRGLRLVVVEDELISALYLEELLMASGVTVAATVGSEPEACTTIERLRPDFVLMDIRLARGGDGIRTAQQVYQRTGIRSLFVTAHTDGGTLTRAAPAAPLGFLSKPYSPEQLISALLQAVAQLKPH
ncbi:response regulator [Zavarzinia sp. CC-PAN008]|uniref:response regulator n=1 Tax=Zavarzinia sp. CC-PAN008 TaxID=3243332 RepID=UPI003F74A8DB